MEDKIKLYDLEVLKLVTDFTLEQKEYFWDLSKKLGKGLIKVIQEFNGAFSDKSLNFYNDDIGKKIKMANAIVEFTLASEI